VAICLVSLGFPRLITRIEAILGEDGKIRDALSSGTMWRGLELIPLGIARASTGLMKLPF